ncbi:tripartite motif-containing protein 10-like [Sphaerodactylus townsendi]|uniref:tripartite motif-containing protein 10-like n=1 Tax=Sphaerodactylus townsendi TaxID=933632 RepID=UPI00202648A2|nr:tripartite motif-containing protein 10-like [Sphaerodactylus townsendi]
MASGSSYTNIEEEANCSICLELLTDPATLDCGHNFCRGCITGYCDKWEKLGDLECPVCKAAIQKGNFHTNWQLANLVEKIKENRFCTRNPGTEEADDPHEAVVVARKRRVCQKHQEPLKLFCKEDEALICVVCDRSKEHRDHETLPLEEASQKYKWEIRRGRAVDPSLLLDRFCDCLEKLKEEREKILACKADVVKESQDLLNQTTEQKQEMVAKFRELHTFLEEQEKLLLAQMEEVEKEVVKNRDQHLVKFSEALSSLASLIQEMEKKCQQPATELLWDVRSTLLRYEEKEAFENPAALPLSLKWRIWDCSDLNLFLEGIKKQLRHKGLLFTFGPFVSTDSLDFGLHPLEKANVTLDPDTAHPRLILSEDRKSVREGGKTQTLPDNPERFDTYGVVLGREGFTGGRHFWEVLVGSEGGWGVGVARKSVRRKGRLYFIPEEGIWVVGKWAGGCYWAVRKGSSICLTLSEEPKRIRVCLNYDGGRVAFFDTDRGALIYEFSGASFSGETLLPYFLVFEKAPLKLSS